MTTPTLPYFNPLLLYRAAVIRCRSGDQEKRVAVIKVITRNLILARDRGARDSRITGVSESRALLKNPTLYSPVRRARDSVIVDQRWEEPDLILTTFAAPWQTVIAASSPWQPAVVAGSLPIRAGLLLPTGSTRQGVAQPHFQTEMAPTSQEAPKASAAFQG